MNNIQFWSSGTYQHYLSLPDNNPAFVPSSEDGWIPWSTSQPPSQNRLSFPVTPIPKKQRIVKI